MLGFDIFLKGWLMVFATSLQSLFWKVLLTVDISLYFRILKNIGMQQVGRNYYHIKDPIMIDKFK